MNKENRKIIGYNLVKTEYERVVTKALGLLKTPYNPFIITDMIGYYLPKIKELGILDWFEPIYEPKKKVVKTISRWVNVYEGEYLYNNGYLSKEIAIRFIDKADNSKYLDTIELKGYYEIKE